MSSSLSASSSLPVSSSLPTLRLLGPIEVVGARSQLTSQQLSLVTYLSCVGPAPREILIEALWDGRPVSDGRFANLVSCVRGRLGAAHLPGARAGRYRLVGLSTDLDRLVALAGLGGGSGGLGDQADPWGSERREAIGFALDGLDGPVLGRPSERWWTWLDRHPEVVAGAEAIVARVADRLVGELVERGALVRAEEVCRRALTCSPLDRNLVLALERLHRIQGRAGTAHRLIERWRVGLERLGSPGTTPGR